MRNVWEKQGGEGGGIEEMYSASCEIWQCFQTCHRNY